MSTRSLIAYEDNSGSIASTYCHMDGYPSYNGAILLAHWNSYERAKELVDNGYISSLKFTIEEINATRANTDRYDVHGSEYGFLRDANALFHEYLYLYKNGAWWVSIAEDFDTPDGYQDRQYYHSKFYELTKHVRPSDFSDLFGGEADWNSLTNNPELKII